MPLAQVQGDACHRRRAFGSDRRLPSIAANAVERLLTPRRFAQQRRIPWPQAVASGRTA